LLPCGTHLRSALAALRLLTLCICWLPVDKDDPLRITDETRSLGLVVRLV